MNYFCKLGAEQRFNLFLSVYLYRELDPDLQKEARIHRVNKQTNKQLTNNLR